MTSLWILLLPAIAILSIGVALGYALHSWAHPPVDFDDGYQTALDALGWINGYNPAGRSS